MNKIALLALLLPTLLLLPGKRVAEAQEQVGIPAPVEILGHAVGASGRLATWSQIVDYFERLADDSPRLRLDTIGESVLGRPMVMAVITSEANQARLEEIRSGQPLLADPRKTTADRIERLIQEQPAVAFIGASLHGDEIMATQMSMELAYDLITDSELVRSLERVVVLLVPSMNPDGLDITHEWWLRTRNTPYVGAPLPWLYHHYVGHDNNRDFFMITQPETRAVTAVLYEQWFPQVVYDVHQMGNVGARFFIPPYADPLNPNIDPLVVRMTNLVGAQMAMALTAAGKTGVSHQATFDLWWHGGARTVAARHNMVGILSEAARADYGDPIVQRPDFLLQPLVGSMYPEPWPGGEWTPRDIVEYELIASKALVRLLDRQREEFVGNFVEAARRQIALGAEGDPFAYIVPLEQRDPGSAAELLRVLRRGGVEVHRAPEPFEVEGRTFAAGSHVILLAQPYRAHAKDLLEPQVYPDIRLFPGGPPAPPYDLAGWTLPMQMGVNVVEITAPFDPAALIPVDSVRVPPGIVRGPPDALAYALDPRQNAAHRAIHEIIRDGGSVNFAAGRLVRNGFDWQAGAPLVWGVPDLRERVERWARELGLDASDLETLPHEEIGSLRVGLYKPWTGSIDEGWTRWLFEEWDVPFESVDDRRMRDGELGRDFDTIVIPSISYVELMRGASRAHLSYAGGLGAPGAGALRDFVDQGGTLVLLDAATDFAIEQLGVPVRNLETAQNPVDPDRWYAPGSLLRVEWDTSHPLAFGMPEESAIFNERSPVFEIRGPAPGVRVVARYPSTAGILMSGYAQGEERIVGRAALLEVTRGRGRVIMFGFRPQHRAQAHVTFKPLFNALYRR